MTVAAEQLRQRHLGASQLLDHLRACCGNRMRQEHHEGGQRVLNQEIEDVAERYLLDLAMRINRANTTERA